MKPGTLVKCKDPREGNVVGVITGDDPGYCPTQKCRTYKVLWINGSPNAHYDLCEVSELKRRGHYHEDSLRVAQMEEM